ncbi:MAG: hypothetical protein ABJB74_17275 [Gemmatimonas sp.]
MKIKNRFAAIALVAIASACSGGDKIVSPDALNNNNNGIKKLSSDDSLYVVNQMSGAAFSSIKALRNITTPTLPGLFANAPQAPCNPSVTGTTDSNGNGIPDDKTTTFTAANCSYTSNGYAFVVTGTIRQQDLNGIYGYRVTYGTFSSVAKKGDSTITQTADGTIEYAFATATSARTQDGVSVTTSVTAPTGSATLARTANLAGTFTPSNGNILVRTAPLPTGTLLLSGTLNVIATATGNQIPTGGPSSQTVSMLISTATALNANIGCSGDASLNAGELQATVGGSQTGAANIKFTACGQGGSGPTTPSGGGKK